MDKIHTTNYFNTFIECAEDSPALRGEEPPLKEDDKSIARLQYEMLKSKPYIFTSDDVLFDIHAIRKDISKEEQEMEREKFFSKGQACFRSSPLTKRYGWGIHFDKKGRMALIGRDEERYEILAKDPSLKVVKAMRTSRK